MPELVTFYAAVPVAKRDDGWLACDYAETIECQSAEEAVQIAAMFARKPGYAAAVVFSRTRDPAIPRQGSMTMPKSSRVRATCSGARSARLGSIDWPSR
jgi:hypothetical protein